MTYEELIDIFKKVCGPLTAAQMTDISMSGLLGVLQAANADAQKQTELVIHARSAATFVCLQCGTNIAGLPCQECGSTAARAVASEHNVVATQFSAQQVTLSAPRNRGGRPVGSKDKKPRKRRRKEGDAREAMAQE